MAKFKQYKGSDRFHFRIYKRNGHHPFVVVMVTEETMEDGHYLLSGYMITHDLAKIKKRPKSYVKLSKNPNPNDDEECFVFLKRFSNIKDSRFSKPYSNWHLHKEDEDFIIELEKRLR